MDSTTLITSIFLVMGSIPALWIAIIFTNTHKFKQFVTTLAAINKQKENIKLTSEDLKSVTIIGYVFYIVAIMLVITSVAIWFL